MAASNLLNHKMFINKTCLRPLAFADFQNCTSVIAKLRFTDSECVILQSQALIYAR